MSKFRKWMIFAPFVFAGAVLLFGWVVMLLWNAILVPVLSVGLLSFWQAVGLLVLTRILFGSMGGGGWKRKGPSPGFRNKWMNMSDEEKLKFKEEWKRRCTPGGE
jgi:Ca2+/H+ antiporter, TMEM165/GDT1 family